LKLAPSAVSTQYSAPCQTAKKFSQAAFGYKVGIYQNSSATSFMIIGAPGYCTISFLVLKVNGSRNVVLSVSDFNTIPKTGAAYIYILKSNVWTLSASFVSPSAYLPNSYATQGGNATYYLSTFGFSVAIFGTYAIIGAPQYSEYIPIAC
jgi:hypothetical protein